MDLTASEASQCALFVRNSNTGMNILKAIGIGIGIYIMIAILGLVEFSVGLLIGTMKRHLYDTNHSKR